ncbi:energy transducer TonB [Chryseobacterium sp.]|uniref:energy transducer TonB n=1 Tax=Chryseobacterium sp. TaxID=1871047 RepID=UPI0025BA6BFE|nr:energy transducer TonB [Chryseobacterium sp.]
MKNLHQSEEFRFNEILFEHRNKEYGAYVLRNESDRILTKSLFIGVGLLAAISITPLIISAFKPIEVITSDGGGFIELPPMHNVDTPEEPLVVVPVQAAQPPVKQYDSTVPEPTTGAHETPTEAIPEGAVAGIKNDFNAEPAKSDEYIPITPTIGTGRTVAPPQIVAPPKAPEVPNDHVADGSELSVEANFVGGIDSFRAKVMDRFDNSGFDGNEGVMTTTVTFIVERDGTISGIKANGKDTNFNNEALRTIKSIKGKWIPGKNKKGEAVRSYFKFPISMKFE